MGKKKKQVGETNEDSGNQTKEGNSIPRAYDNDTDNTIALISMSQELKDEGNKFFQKRDVEGALLKYQKALKLLPTNHMDVSYLRSNMAACYMQMRLSEYPRAIHECNLALEVTPNYSKAMLKRARCYEALNRLDLALRDVSTVVKMDPDNVMGLEILERVKNALEEKGLRVNDANIELPLDYVEPPNALPPEKIVKEKTRKKKSNKEEEKPLDGKVLEKKPEKKCEEMKVENGIVVEEKKTKSKKNSNNEDDRPLDNKVLEKKSEEKFEEMKVENGIVIEETKTSKSKKKKAKEKINEKEADIKEVVEEKINGGRENVTKKTVKLIFGDDIRCAELPVNCSLLELREVILDRFPSLGAILVKYKDQEADLITITSEDELRWAETGSHGSIRLHIVEATPQQDPFFEKLKAREGKMNSVNDAPENSCVGESREIISSSSIDDWIIHFAKLFKNHVSVESDRYLDFHELGEKLYSEAMEETITSEEAQDLFDLAGDKFQEMYALALFNWGNVHMSRARKKVYFIEDSSKEQLHEQIRSSYEWAQKEYVKAGEKYEAAIKIKSDFYEGFLALAQQQFEKAKLSWYHALSSNVDLVTWPSTEVFQLYSNAEVNMEKGMQIWEKSKISNSTDVGLHLQNMGLDGLLNYLSLDENATQEASMMSQINLQWGSMLYERSITEFKLGKPIWHESLKVAVEKFELGGASSTDIAVLLKNHCSNNTSANDGLAFKIDEIVQALSEMHTAKKWQGGVPSFRLEPLLRRRVSKIYHAF